MYGLEGISDAHSLTRFQPSSSTIEAKEVWLQESYRFDALILVKIGEVSDLGITKSTPDLLTYRYDTPTGG